MKRILTVIVFSVLVCISAAWYKGADMQITHTATADSVGACQGISYQNNRVFLYGDRDIGMIREYKLAKDSLVYQHKEYKLTINGQDIINHPTGIAHNGTGPTFIGNSVKLNAEGTKWKAVIYQVDWPGLLRTRTLDGNLLSTVDDDACIQGTRPEYVKYHNKWYVATADYGEHGNEVRLYDPLALKKCRKTSEKGVLFKKFSCSPWVQNLHWLSAKGILILVQNQVEGRKWRFTYVDLEKSVNSGQMVVIKQIDLAPQDELEGFAFVGDINKGIAVSSSRSNNMAFINTTW
jgi:hypothetical protein